MMNSMFLFIVLTLAQVTQYKEQAKSAFDNAESQILAKVVVPDVVKKCPCDGKGYILQGDGHKSECPGLNGEPCKFKRNRETPPVVKQKAEEPLNGVIFMYTKNGCLPCLRWKSGVMPRLVGVGWRVLERPMERFAHPSYVRSYPSFDVWVQGKRYTVEGALTAERLNEINSIHVKVK